MTVEFIARGRPLASILSQQGRQRYFESEKSLLEAGLRSFDDNFWLIQETEGWKESDGYARRHLLLVSKSPMVFERYVALDCRSYCTAVTIAFRDDPKTEKPNILVDGIPAWLDTPAPCPTGKTGPECKAGARRFVAPETLPWVEAILTALMQKPEAETR